MLMPISSSKPLIGVIVRELEGQLPRRVDDPPTSDETREIEAIYYRFDTKYQDRPDYKLWRSAIPLRGVARILGSEKSQTALSIEWKDWPHFARECATSSDDAIFWSTVALAPEMIATVVRTSACGEGTPIWTFATTLYNRLRHERFPLSVSPASCGLAAALFLVRFHWLNEQVRGREPLATCIELFKEIRRWIAFLDPSWVPGEKIDTSVLEHERKGQGRLRVAHDIYEFDAFVGFLRTLRPILSTHISELNVTTRAMLSDAYKYARTAWYEARSRRLWDEEYQKKINLYDTERSKKSRRKAYLVELQCLLNLSSAARDAGLYLESAKLLYLLFRLVPEEFRKDSAVERQLRVRSIVFRYIKEAGLEVDSRFRTETSSYVTPDVIETTETEEAAPAPQVPLSPADDVVELASQQPLTSDLVTEPASPDEAPKHSLATNPETGFYLAVEHDQRYHKAWQTILREIPKRDHETPPGYLLTVMKRLGDARAPASPEALIASFNLARKYGYVRTAAKILSRAVYKNDFPLTPKLVMDFVHSVRRCVTLDPFGMRHEKIMLWRSLILDACAKIYNARANGGEWFFPDHKLWIHETLLGRTHTHHRSLNASDASRLFRKAAGTYDVSDLREFYDRTYRFDIKPYGVATEKTISRYCSQFDSSALGPPVMVSALLIGENLSIIAIGKNGVATSSDVHVGDLKHSIDGLKKGAEFWFKATTLQFGNQIDWPPVLQRVARSITDLVEKCDPASKVILLAVEPMLAGLPWQHLIFSSSVAAQTQTGRLYLTAIIPNFSTATIDRRIEDVDVDKGIAILISEETDRAIAEVAPVIVQTTTSLKEAPHASACIVLGHGFRGETQAMAGVRMGNGQFLLSIDDWIGVLHRKHIILHCCNSGTAEPIFMDELGGLPGLGLSLCAEIFVAPVAEVSSAVAIVFQENLFANEGRREIGISYLHAISQSPAVSLYNLYGNPYERLMPSTQDNHTTNS